jgi:hypothetical protein
LTVPALELLQEHYRYQSYASARGGSKRKKKMCSEQRISGSRNQSIDLNDLSRIWCGYFPETEIVLTDPKLHLIAQLRQFFASREASSFLSQVSIRHYFLKKFG